MRAANGLGTEFKNWVITVSEKDHEKTDAVTVGQIRMRYEAQLESQIAELGRLIRKGYFERSKSETYLRDVIGETQTKLQNIEAMASTEVYFPFEQSAKELRQ